MDTSPLFLALTLVIALIAICNVYLLVRMLGLSLQARRQGLELSPVDVMRLELRRIDSRVLIDAHGIAARAGVALPFDQLVAWSREGLPVLRLATVLALGAKAGLTLDVEDLLARVRAGQDPFTEVERRARTTDGFRA